MESADQWGVQIPLWAWGLFLGIAIALLVIDLIATSGERAQSRRWVLLWGVIWISIGTAFAGLIWLLKGGHATVQYLTVYLLELSLSMDNMFVFLIIFSSLGIPAQYQHKALFWGVMGAVFFRALFIFLGAAALERFHWIIYILAALLLYAAWRTFREDPREETESRLAKRLAGARRVSEKVHEGHFVAKENGRWVLTAVGISLVAIELTDIMFAIDSIAAALSITHERYVLFTANIFAVLGLRAMYLVLASVIGDWPYLHYGIAAVLAFTALKLLLEPIYKIPLWATLVFIVAAITISIVASIRSNRRHSGEAQG